MWWRVRLHLGVYLTPQSGEVPRRWAARLTRLAAQPRTRRTGPGTGGNHASTVHTNTPTRRDTTTSRTTNALFTKCTHINNRRMHDRARAMRGQSSTYTRMHDRARAMRGQSSTYTSAGLNHSVHYISRWPTPAARGGPRTPAARFEGRVRGQHEDAALAARLRVAALDEDVAVHAPRRASRVLDLPVVGAVRVGAVARGEDAVVERGAAAAGEERPTSRAAERELVGLDGDRDWLLGDGRQEGPLTLLLPPRPTSV